MEKNKAGKGDMRICKQLLLKNEDSQGRPAFEYGNLSKNLNKVTSYETLQGKMKSHAIYRIRHFFTLL